MYIYADLPHLITEAGTERLTAGLVEIVSYLLRLHNRMFHGNLKYFLASLMSLEYDYSIKKRSAYMIDIAMMFERLRRILSDERGGVSISNIEIASELGYSCPSSLSTIASRHSIPFERISEFCAKRSILINWVLYGQHSDMVVANTLLVMPRYKIANNPA